MAKYFEINGEEIELKITWEGAKRLNEHFGGGEAGALAVVGKALEGDLDTIPKVIQAATLHTGKRLPLTVIEKEIATKVDAEELDLYDLMVTVKEVVADSFFYKRAKDKMMSMVAGNEEQVKALESFYEVSE